jgi:hypothetical protein
MIALASRGLICLQAQSNAYNARVPKAQYAIGKYRCMALGIRLVDSADEFVLDDVAITFPILVVLDRAALKVGSTVMHEHDDEEDGVEVGNDRRASDYSTLAEARGPVSDIVLRKRDDTSKVKEDIRM